MTLTFNKKLVFTLSRADLTAHCHQAHALEDFICSQCPRRTKKQNNEQAHRWLCKHRNQYHFRGEFECTFPSCGQSYTTRAQMYGHYAEVHIARAEEELGPPNEIELNLPPNFIPLMKVILDYSAKLQYLYYNRR